ncbi:MAG: serine/threonine protein kinase [Planctomycetes bacterium]|nr:serine/threonine protein kinase [Planctomycetota bacterium]
MMTGESEWYRDATELLGVVKRTRRKRRRPPTIVGYDDFRELQRGGQGIVYTARQRSTKRRVAVKVLLQGAFANESGRRRFEREIDLVANLHHPNIVSVYDSGVTSDDELYFVMEYVEGVALNEYMDAQPRDADEVLHLFSKICGAINSAHQRGVIHRDLKPTNILVDAAGEPHVLDFGVAKQFGQSGSSDTTVTLTQPDGFLGTLAYAAPEQLSGDATQIDTRTDVYALGMILYALLTGEHAYDVSGAMADVIKTITEQEPRAPSVAYRESGGVGITPASARRRLNHELDTILLTALAKRPERRYQSVAELREDIERLLAGLPIHAKRDSRWYVLRKTLGRHKAAVAAVALFLVMIVGFGVTMSLLYGRAVGAEALARAEQQRAEKESASARASAKTSGRINVFLREMLASADPYITGGPDVTVRSVLEAAAEKVDKELAGEPKVAAGVHLTIGNAYRGLGLYDEAASHLRAAVEALRAVEGEEPVEFATSQFDLASLLRAKGAHDEAAGLYAAALATYREQLGNEHAFVAHALLSLGGFYVEQGRFEDAEPLLREALQRNRQRLGDQPHPDMAFTLLHMAGLLHGTGRDAEAEPLFRESLTIYQKVFGEKHPAVAFCLNDLGLVHQALGNHDDAERLFREALVMRLELLGDDHPDTLASRGNLAVLLANLGRHDEAGPMLRRTLAERRRVLGESHRDTLRSANDLAHWLLVRGQLAEANALYRTSLELSRSALGENHALTIQFETGLAGVVERQADPGE